MEFKEETLFVLKLTLEELRLVCRALGGRLKEEEELARAKKLDRDIAQARIQRAKAVSTEMHKLQENIDQSLSVV